MPSRPPRFTLHTKQDRHKEYDKHRGDRHQRGYGDDWYRTSEAYRNEHPLCARCEKNGHITPAVLVDHIEPLQGRDDPKRLDWNNLQSLCQSCHNIKTNEDMKNGKLPKRH